MANIPVERTSTGTPWWVWLLGLLVLAGLIWLIAELLSDDDPDAYVAEDPVVVVDPVEPAPTEATPTGAITSLDELREARRAGALYGREVDLDDVRVETVPGDSSFFIADPDTRGDARLLVVLEDLGESEPNQTDRMGSDGRYNVDEDDEVDITGRVERFQGDEPEVTGANRDRLVPDSLYIRASRVAAASDDTGVQTSAGDPGTATPPEDQ